MTDNSSTEVPYHNEFTKNYTRPGHARTTETASPETKETIAAGTTATSQTTPAPKATVDAGCSPDA